MSKLKKPIEIETAFGEYVVSEILGEGGAGRVYGGVDTTNSKIAIKVLTQTSKSKRQRFKNEIGFLYRNKHPNIVTVLDHGVANGTDLKGPFYVMRRYDGSLRDLMKNKIPHVDVLAKFSQILNGVEAAHFLGGTHRDLKPENILFEAKTGNLVVADFGIASFTHDQLTTLIETGPEDRLANFQYAAPEQRMRGQESSHATDIYALGLMLNEIYTSVVPHGTDYRLIAHISDQYEYLDRIVALMIKQNKEERPQSIADVKQLISKYEVESISLQRLSALKGTVIPVGEVDEPLAYDAPILTGVNWANGNLTLHLDRSVTQDWVHAFYHLSNYTALQGVGPERFHFSDTAVEVDLPLRFSSR